MGRFTYPQILLVRNLCTAVLWCNSMRRSLHVSAPLLASAALAVLTACRQPQMQRCVDATGKVVADTFCGAPQGQQNNNFYRPPGTGSYRWYYGGGGGYSPGTVVGGGSYTPLSGGSYATSTSRGGFGSSFSGGEGGEGGGHGGGGGE